MVGAGHGDVDVGVGDVCPGGEEGWEFGPVEEVGGGCDAELRGDVVEGCVGYVEGAVDADDSGVFGAAYCFVGFRGEDDGFVEACEVVAVCGPGEAD